MSNLRWKLITILAVFVVFFARRRLPDPRRALRPPVAGLADGQAAEARPRPEGRRPPRAARPDRRCAAARDRAGDGAAARGAEDAQTSRSTNIDAPDPTHFQVEGVPPAQDAAFRQAADEVAGQLRPRLRRQRHLHVHDEAEHRRRTCATRRWCRRAQTIERRVNELGVTEPSIAQQGENGDQILVQLPGVTDVERAKEIIRSTGLLELKIVEQGPAATSEALLRATARCRRAWRSCPASAARRRRRRHGVLPGAQGGGGHRPATCAARGRRSTRTTSRRSASR